MNYFDLHCDTATKMLDHSRPFFKNDLHFSIEKAKAIGHMTQVFALWTSDDYAGQSAADRFSAVYNNFIAEAAKNAGDFVLARRYSDLQDGRRRGKVCGLLSMESASPLMGDPAQLQSYYDQGVRSLTLTWNADTEFAGCCLTESGLTPAGAGLLREMERLRLPLDVSHLNKKSFWQAAGQFSGVIFASHSNAATEHPHRRNLTDAQCKAVAETGGVIGLNFHAEFLNGTSVADEHDYVRHLRHLLNAAGEQAVAVGGDLDGIPLYSDFHSVADIPRIYEKAAALLHSERLAGLIFFGNADDMYRRILE